MDKSSVNRADSGSKVLVYTTATSGSSSTATVTSSSTSGEEASVSATKMKENKSLKKFPLAEHQENLHSSRQLVDVGTITNEQAANYSFNSSSTSIMEFPTNLTDVSTSTEKINSDSTLSTASSLSASRSLELQKHKKDPAVQPLKTFSPSASTATIEIILREPSKRNVSDTTWPSSTASISVGHNQWISDYLPKTGAVERHEPFENNTTIPTDIPLTIQESKSSVVSSIFKGVSVIKVERKSVSTDDDRTVQFSLQDSDSQHHESQGNKELLTASLKPSKSHPLKSQGDDSFDEIDSIRSTNLKPGHVFVYMFVPPDGGYGWFICFISFLCQIVIDGIVYSVGILLPHIAKDFNIQGSEVILIASLQTGFYFLSGTVASAFINKYGFRSVAFTGALLSITFLTLATFSVNLPMMILFHSILGGPALSLIWVSSQLVTGYYFDRYRPIANGASCSGAGIGIMLFSLMNSVLVPVMSWRNIMRLHVAFLVVVLFMSLSFVEVALTRIGRVKEEEPLAEDTDSESWDTVHAVTNYSKFSLKVDNQEYPLRSTFETTMDDTTPSASCLEKCCPFLTRYWKRQHELKPQEESTKRFIIQPDYIERNDFFYSGPKDVETENLNVEQLSQKDFNIITSRESEDFKWRTVSLEEIDNTFKRNTIIKNLSSRKAIADEETKEYRLTYAELKIAKKRPLLAFLSPRNWLHPKLQKAFSLLFDFRLLAIMEFRILLLSAFLFPMGFNIPFVYSTVRAQVDASFAKLITPTIGFSNFAFRIASGLIAFKFREYTTYICGGGMFFGGFAVFVSAFYGLNVVWFQFLYALCYGIAPAFFSTLRAIIYVRALGLDKLTNAFGLTALAMGLGVFIGTTAGGILNDLTGSYTASFIFAGICICTAGGLKLLLPYFIKLFKYKERN